MNRHFKRILNLKTDYCNHITLVFLFESSLICFHNNFIAWSYDLFIRFKDWNVYLFRYLQTTYYHQGLGFTTKWMGTRRDIVTYVLGRLGVCRIHITRAALLPSALKQQNKRSTSKSEACVSYIYILCFGTYWSCFLISRGLCQNMV